MLKGILFAALIAGACVVPAPAPSTPMQRCISAVQADPGVQNIATQKGVQLSALAARVCAEPEILAQYERGTP